MEPLLSLIVDRAGRGPGAGVPSRPHQGPSIKSRILYQSQGSHRKLSALEGALWCCGANINRELRASESDRSRRAAQDNLRTQAGDGQESASLQTSLCSWNLDSSGS